MFSALQQQPADPILGLSVKFKADANPNKIDLGAGIYKDEAGHTPVLHCVKAAEKLRLENETSKTYITSAGSALFNEKSAALNLGDHRVILGHGYLLSLSAILAKKLVSVSMLRFSIPLCEITNKLAMWSHRRPSTCECCYPYTYPLPRDLKALTLAPISSHH